MVANGFAHDGSGDDDELEAGEQMLHKLRQYISRFLARSLRYGPDKWHHATNSFRLSMAEAVLALQRMEADHHAAEPTVHPHADIAATAIVRLALLVDQLRAMQEEEDGESEGGDL